MDRSFASQHWTADTLAKVFGAIFIIVGILGFIPNALVSYRGVFEVNTLHNIVHIITGGILLASPYYSAPVITLRVIGVIYALLTIVGFVSLNSLSFIALNHPDNWLHLIVAIALLWAGYSLPAEDRDRITTAHM